MSSTPSASSSRMKSSGLYLALSKSGRCRPLTSFLCFLTSPNGSTRTTRRPISRRRRATTGNSSPRGSRITVDPLKPRSRGDSRFSAIVAPLPTRGGARVIADPSRPQPTSGAFGLRPICRQQYPVPPHELLHVAAAEERRRPEELRPGVPALAAPRRAPQRLQEGRPGPARRRSRRPRPAPPAAPGRTRRDRRRGGSALSATRPRATPAPHMSAPPRHRREAPPRSTPRAPTTGPTSPR